MAAFLVGPAPAAKGDMKAYETPYYVVYSDLDLDGVREAAVRLTAMAEEYHRRTSGFGGVIRSKLPFYLFRSAEDYHAAGGAPNTNGYYTGKKLMAIAGATASASAWHVVQHEGFHQFAHAVIRGDLPMWINEGLAEYFGEGLFTGDLFVVGVVPPGRLARLKREIQTGQLKPLPEMMTLDNKTWNAQISITHYDQAWSMVHFLVHADEGKYVRALTGLVNDISGGMGYEPAWAKNFGRDIGGFERRWREYWLPLPESPTADLYAKATVATLTSYFARAFSQRQTFASPEEFFQAARAGRLKAHPEDWLPPALLTEALGKAKGLGNWSIATPPGKTPQLVCQAADGTKFVGTFALGPSAGRVGHIDVELVREEGPAPATRPAAGPISQPATRPAPPPAQVPIAPGPPTAPAADALPSAINLAKAYQAMGEKDKARKVLEEALRESPDSPRADEARRLLRELN